MSHATIRTILSTLRENFSRFGIPRTTVTDKGTEFTSAEFAKFLEDNNADRAVKPAPQRLSKRVVRTVKEGLTKLNQGTLTTRLAELPFRHRRTPIRCGTSAQRLLGHQLRSRLHTYFPSPPFFPFYLQEPNELSLQPGDAIWARVFGSGNKWLPGSQAVCRLPHNDSAGPRRNRSASCRPSPSPKRLRHRLRELTKKDKQDQRSSSCCLSHPGKIRHKPATTTSTTTSIDQVVEASPKIHTEGWRDVTK